jgi:hypothetical protein
MQSRGWLGRGRLVAGMMAFLVGCGVAWGGGPRYVTGPPFFTGPAGVPIGWKQANLQYYTDPGGLSASVNHRAADALVAAAAGVWNVPVASISVSQGGELAEHVSGANVYLSSDGLVWPWDVASTNAAAIAVAVVYDSDGSVTDTLLGAGASGPAGCELNAVTETVDAFDPAGYILHAIVVVNGRCTGPAPEQQRQMQYKLERAFGRILGLAWSQTNDNVFTGTPQPNADQANHWPIMHPIEILCGPYSYQCLPSAFTLRPDDIAGLVSVYPIGAGVTPAAGKQVSLADATAGRGTVSFPDGEGMGGVNVVSVREPTFTVSPEDWYEVSGVSGSLFRASGGSPFVSADTSALGSMGSTAAGARGVYSLAYFALVGGVPYQNVITSTEPVNPLYRGAASVGVYGAGAVAPAGSAPLAYLIGEVGPGQVANVNFAIGDAPSACGNGGDGSAAAPVTAPASGWWTGLLCGYGHAAYAAFALPAGRSVTVEVTALDANGLATTSKAMPSIGLFAPSDGASALPSLGVQPGAFNALSVGMTTLTVSPSSGAFAAGGVVGVGVADERGEGRPDFAIQTRVFLASSVAPAEVPTAGGTTLTITGMGFRQGNEVLVNGVVAAAGSWTSTTIVATVPSLALAGATAGVPVDVEVLDLGTGASSTMSGALTYGVGAGLPNTMELVSLQSATTPAGSATAVPFSVQVLKSDGVTPVMGATVLFSTTSGSAHFGVCGKASCSVTTDVNGMASTAVTPMAAGTVSLKATDAGSGAFASGSFVAGPQVVSLQVLSAPSGDLTVGQVAMPAFAVNVLGTNGQGLPGTAVTFAVAPGSIGSAALSPCNAPVCTVASNQWGGAGVNVTPSAGGAVTLIATSGAAQTQTSFSAVALPDVLVLDAVPNATAYVNQSAGAFTVQLMRGDGVTVVPYVPLTFSAAPGVQFSGCVSNICTAETDYVGRLGMYVVATQAGTYTLTVSYGSVSQSVQLVVTVPQPQLKLVSAPSGNVPVGTVAAQMLTAQLLDAQGNPWGNQLVTIGGPLGAVSMGCAPNTGSCVLFTDGNGMVSSQVTPLLAGTITMEAVYGNLLQQASFTSVGTAERFFVLTPPPASVTVGSPVSFTLQAIGPDGVSPEVNHDAFFTTLRGSFAYTYCQVENCEFGTDSQGLITQSGTVWQPGPVTIQAVLDGLTVTMSFNVVQPVQTMKLVSAPSGSFQAGATIQPALAVQVLGADGVTGVSKQNVTFSAGGGVTIAACTMPCVVMTDANGMASTGAVRVSGAGTYALTAADNGMTQTANFAVVAPPDVVSLMGAPRSVYQGATAGTPFSVKVTLADGATPAAGVAVVFSLMPGSGAATFAACGAASCTLTTNAAGVASSAVTGTQVGEVTLEGAAQLPTGAATVSSGLAVLANVYTVTAGVSNFYVAEGATVAETLWLQALENGATASGQAVRWTGGSGFAVSGASSTTDAGGSASMQATVGPLAAGASGLANGCAWPTVCAPFTAMGVSAGLWQLQVASGGNQAATGGAALSPVVVQVTDGAGHALAGATVTIGQTVRAFDATCGAEGRCPVGAVLASGASSGISDASGRVSVTPMGIAGVATSTSLAFTAGLQGFATAVVSSTP